MTTARAVHCAETLLDRYAQVLEDNRGYCGLLARAAADRAFGLTSLTVWECSDVPRIQRSTVRGIPIRCYQVRDLLVANSDGNESEVQFLARLTGASGGVWPDVLFVYDDPIKQAQQAGLDPVDWLGRAYHLIEPGGMVCVSMEGVSEESRGVIRTAAEQLGVDALNVDCSFLTLQKDSSIYCSPHIKVANRTSIFMPETCERTVAEAVNRLPLQSGATLLDVGVGDGRFSIHFLRESAKRGWNYSGLEIATKSAMQPRFPELLPATRFGTNFFSIEPEQERYDAIVLIFVFHAFRYWPLYLYQAFRLLRPGGVVLLSNRTDPFLRWTHGDFTEEERDQADPAESPILTECRNYWHMRDVCGVRLFDQIATATEVDTCVDAAEHHGFEYLDRIEVASPRTYHLNRTDLCPDEGGPAMWNVGRIGVSGVDGRRLRAAWTNALVEDQLTENMILTVMRRP